MIFCWRVSGVRLAAAVDPTPPEKGLIPNEAAGAQGYWALGQWRVRWRVFLASAIETIAVQSHLR
jgi:hypothetical protein